MSDCPRTSHVERKGRRRPCRYTWEQHVLKLEETIYILSLKLLGVIEAHPWVGTALTRAAGQAPMHRILERLSHSLRALGVPPASKWSTVFAPASYILGVAEQNAANAQLAQRSECADRAALLEELATQWSLLGMRPAKSS